ncbi:hypothetical protein ABW20_dc0108575 [Dactylellina cionopaga]|nr:hypothetical protein ABW20_dc0108575 [Dactylellina cionopaga]
MPRQRKAQKTKTAQVDSGSDSEIEEIPRKTLLDQIDSLQAGVPFDVKSLKAPLAEALSGTGKKGKKGKKDVTFEEYDIPMGMPERTHPPPPKKDAEEEEEEDDVDVIGDLGQTFFFSIPLTILLCGFYMLVQYQYLEQPSRKESILRSVKSFLPIWFTLYITHPRKSWAIVQFAFFATAVGSGCWMVYNVNKNGYYAVMKMVPPLGTMMVYSVIQMELTPAAFTVVAILSYVWYNDFSIFT